MLARDVGSIAQMGGTGSLRMGYRILSTNPPPRLHNATTIGGYAVDIT
jgi:hypothetical protein